MGSSAREEDLGETRLLRRGRSLGAPPGETFPGVGPPIFAYCIANTVCPGTRAGEFFLRAGGGLKI